MAEDSSDGRKKFLVLLYSGLNDPPRAKSALMFASLSAAFDFETTVYCVQDGADVVLEGGLAGERAAPGLPTIKQRLEEAIAAGVKLQLCEQTARNKKIEPEDLIEQAEIVSGALLIDHTVGSDGVLCF